MNRAAVDTTAPGAAISLPKGGGAIASIGETFQASVFTGDASFTVPIFTTEARGARAALALQYSSALGDSVFGSGWQLQLPKITRKTRKGLPRYDDSDVFVMSGTEDLEIELKDNLPNTVTLQHKGQEFEITRYRTRTEAHFARIERWEELPRTASDRASFWRVTTADNVTNYFGFTRNARIEQRAESSSQPKIYEWLLDETLDALGNHTLYEYAADSPSLGAGLHQERNREYHQKYIRRIFYGNLPASASLNTIYPVRTGATHDHPVERVSRAYLFEVLFDYGDIATPDHQQSQYHHFFLDTSVRQEVFLTGDESGSTATVRTAVPLRVDPFSSFRPGFELRTMRRCRRVLMVHHIPELGGATLVKSTEFEYREGVPTKQSQLVSAAVVGYKRQGAGYIIRQLPALQFEYSEFSPGVHRYQKVHAFNDEMPAVSLNDADTELVDVTGNGIPDIVQTTPIGLRYWRNLGNGLFDRPKPFSESPAGIRLSQPGVSIGDQDGDGLADLIVHDRVVAGFFPMNAGASWSPSSFQHYEFVPGVDLKHPDVKLVDLTGDGLSDILITARDHLVWYQSLGEAGFAPAQLVPRVHDLDTFPDVHFSDPAGRVRLADMTGDGLNDIVLITDGRIDYWPNVGYGRFGRRITMLRSPKIGVDFDPARLMFADVDGSGAADVVYIGYCDVTVWFNQSGNGLSKPTVLHGTPLTVDATSLKFTDLFGTGTACLVWSNDVGQIHAGNYNVLDFCGGVKPHLLTGMSNSRGLSIRVAYASSTHFCLEDAENNRPWLTALPFPVQVVAKTEIIDRISQTKLVSTYQYHHGYYDGREREFRGFGRVDQFDTEFFSPFASAGLHDADEEFANSSQSFHSPPVETRTWFHTGALLEGPVLEQRYAAEYWSDDDQAFAVADHQLDLVSGAERSAFDARRALRGSVLRVEVYGRDGSDHADRPYLVTENRYRVTELQAGNKTERGILRVSPLESFSFHYERRSSDPRIQHELTLASDTLGNPTLSASVYYRRRAGQHPEQDRDLIQLKATGYIQSDDSLNAFLHSHVFEARGFELTGVQRPVGEPFSVAELVTAYSSATLRHYAEDPDWLRVQKRLIEHQLTVYWNHELSAAETVGRAAFHGLVYQTYRLALTSHLRQSVFGDKVTIQMGRDAGYRRRSGNSWLPAAKGDWWAPSGTISYDPTIFYLPTKSIDPFGNQSTTEYDDYGLMVTRQIDPLGGALETISDYRVLQPRLTRDINGNHTEIAHDALGVMVGQAVMGKAGRNPSQSLLDASSSDLIQMRASTQADSLDGFEADLPESVVRACMNDPDGEGEAPYAAKLARQALQKASSRTLYDLHCHRIDGGPSRKMTIARERHAKDAAVTSPLQLGFVYIDGLGRVVQSKAQSSDGADGTRRWIASGWQVLNNKGSPVQQFEPHFTPSHDFEPNAQVGVSSVLFYDPLQRVVCILNPNGSYSKTLISPWSRTIWDANDTVLLTPQNDPDVMHLTSAHIAAIPGYASWYRQRIPDSATPPTALTADAHAAVKTKAHAETPAIERLDAQGKTFLAIGDNKTESLQTRSVADIEGLVIAITDPRSNEAARYGYDILGRKAVVNTKDAGDKCVFMSVDDRPLYHWDAKDEAVVKRYDELRRLTETRSIEPGLNALLTEVRIYGERRPQAELSNARGQLWQQFDGAGLRTIEQIDFKGNTLREDRRVLANARADRPNWPTDGAGLLDQPSAYSLLQPTTALGATSFALLSEFDALNRAHWQQLPDGTVQSPNYDQGGLLSSVTVTLAGQAEHPYIKSMRYNARGQQLAIEYGNGVETIFEYDRQTFRLVMARSNRTGTRSRKLRDLVYTYDPVGNIMQIRDAAHRRIFHRNQVVSSDNLYTYDAVYRLIEATGREHESMSACHYSHLENKRTEYLPLPQSVSNPQALSNYVERYRYDSAGNIERIERSNSMGSTIRRQTYANDSNRIQTSKAGCQGEQATLAHDANGNMLALPNLPGLNWNHNNQLVSVQLTQGADPNRAHYQYDSEGHRVRKLVVKNGGHLVEDRIYLGDYEVAFKSVAGRTTSIRETIHVGDGANRIAVVEQKRSVANIAQISPAVVRYQLGDQKGSVCLELDHDAKLISYEEYYPFGEAAYIAGPSLAEVSLKRYRYAAKERDVESGLIYFGARYFVPWLGRWLNADRIDMTDDINLYRFAKNDPVRRRDAAGYASEDTVDTSDDEGDVVEMLSDPDYWAAVAKVGTLIGIRKAKASLIPLGGMQAVVEDEMRATVLVSQGDYDGAVKVASGLEEYVDLVEESESTGDAAALVIGEKLGTNHMVEGYTGEDRTGEELSGWQRAGKWAIGGIKMLATAGELLTGTSYVRGKLGSGTGPKLLPPGPSPATVYKNAEKALSATRASRLKHFNQMSEGLEIGQLRERFRDTAAAFRAEARRVEDGTFSGIEGLDSFNASQRKVLADKNLAKSLRELEGAYKKALTARQLNEVGPVEVGEGAQQQMHDAVRRELRVGARRH